MNTNLRSQYTLGQPIRPTYQVKPHLHFKGGFWHVVGIYGRVQGATLVSAWSNYQRVKSEATTRKVPSQAPAKVETYTPPVSIGDPVFGGSLLGMGLGLGFF